jgi:hypothetical protein
MFNLSDGRTVAESTEDPKQQEAAASTTDANSLRC